MSNSALTREVRLGTVPADSSSGPPARKRRSLRRNNRVGYLFIAPSIVGFGLFVAYPLVMSIYYSLTRWNGVTKPQFIGLDNYVYMLTKDPVFWIAVRNTLVFAVISVPVSLIAGLALAVLLNRKLKGVKIFRTIFFLPVVLPSIAVLTMWKYLFDPQFGLANQILSWLHLPTSQWLSSADTAMPTVILIGVWGVGGTMIIFLAGLQNVPDELYEAAKLDGAGAIRTFFSVTLPMITPILLLQLILQINGAFQTFNQIAILTQGGPDNSTDLLMYKIYTDGFTSVNNPLMGYATAEVWFLFILVMIVTAFTFRTSSMWVYNANETRN
ncbi:sugar ABC transporter permease [Microlunatus elymi]|uniref:Sugar ABC transporter permease n=1 Tax=Microlunatus elymi TaxID=2596828 RepID=A0A516PX26_9ACTN|nr:sugar ABC transporter permease [Microlunatus elymi]QDP95720.1 sugar ABC transporter permease [Microlunatus elymi]